MASRISRAAARACGDQARPDREVRGLLSGSRRQLPRPGRIGRTDALAADQL